MSNKKATVNRVTLLESIEAAKAFIVSTAKFHGLSVMDYDSSRSLILGDCMLAVCGLRRAEILAAELEAWGEGP